MRFADELLGHANDFATSVDDGAFAKEDWPQNNCELSKILMTCLARFIAKDHQNEGVLCHSCCLG